MKILLVYNSFAGHGRAKKILPQVEGFFNKYKIDFELFKKFELISNLFFKKNSKNIILFDIINWL